MGAEKEGAFPIRAMYFFTPSRVARLGTDTRPVGRKGKKGEDEESNIFGLEQRTYMGEEERKLRLRERIKKLQYMYIVINNLQLLLQKSKKNTKLTENTL